FNFLSTIESSTKALMNTAAADKQKQMTAVQSTSAFKSLTPEQQSQITSAVTGTPTSAETIAANISSNIENMKTVLSEASSSAPSNNNSQNFQTLSGTANNLVLKAISDLDKIQKLPTATKQLYQGSQTLTKGITDYTNAVGQLRKGAETLDSKSNQLISGTQKASQGAQTLDSKSDQLRDGAGQLASGSDRIADGSNKLAGGGHQLTDGLTELSGGVSQLSSSLGKAGDQLSMVSVNKDNANAVSSPVTIKHEDYDSVDTNGVGMAPYMISVALMVVALSANVIFAKALSGKEPANRFSWAKNKLLINGFIATLAATILFFAVQFIGLKPDYPGKTYFIILLTAWTLMALVTALVGWDNRYGSFLSLLILLFQLGSSAGTYPIELSPKFFQTIQPFLPMTYSVSGLRETISLTGDVNHQWRMLVIFLVSSMILALLIYRKQED
ncbi:YhgE/Pip domain-containing protein, partial [Streptococcus agalactiae]|nr:YhgE/Pip domain-containing protein [Streptococcus agalactiae]